MNLSTTCILFLSAIVTTKARLGSERTLALRNSPQSQSSAGPASRRGGAAGPQTHESESKCAEGYTCWEDKSGGLWAKKDSVATGMDCDSVCFSAYAGGSTSHSCRQGVTAPEDASDLTEVIFGQETFNCNGSPSFPSQCWGNKSPESVSGAILVTGNANDFSKNCYYPSEETLSCDVPIDHANCFGERFASICPCKQEEEHKITESTQWRLFTHSEYDKGGRNTWSWDLDNINFYSSSDCSGIPLDLPEEPTKYTDSLNAGSAWTPDQAFGNNSGIWGGREDNGKDGNLWIAIEFPTAVHVGCVQFHQAANYAKYIKLEAVPTGSTIWHTVEFVTNGHAGTNKIQLL